ncbi:hypothetical protein [Hymenobacter sp. APR13]|uniref:hypothetical protein n=1 Tax=Hymenobacter sp. APR13 TaxID=1356852 RepID=UPI0004E08C47|nr:hypothetical protein [Hymenobacter sp. APR13]AII53503.1 hypothetical protein N008_16160 [Hymenobacter sp. APR13]
MLFSFQDRPAVRYGAVAACGLLSVFSVAATAQTKLAATITLDKKEIPGAVLQLQNGNVALFVSKPKESTVRVLLLQPDGKVKWEKSVAKLQGLQVLRDPQQPAGTFNRAWVEELYPTLEPLEVFAQGNTLYAAEVVDKDLDRLDKKDDIHQHDILLQRLDSTGTTQRMVLPYTKIPQHTTVKGVLSYVEGNVFYQVSREQNSRQGTDEYVLNSFDLARNTTQRTPLNLAPLNNSRWAPNFKEFWAPLGHHQGITYLYRRYKSSAGTTPEPIMQQQYELLAFDNLGRQVAPAMQPGLGLGDYRIMGKLLQPAAFFLDAEAGQVLVSGAYQQTAKSRLMQDPVTAGFFLDRFAPTGQLVSHQQVAYADVLPAQQKNLVKQLGESDGAMVFQDLVSRQFVADVALKDSHALLYFSPELAFEKVVVTPEKERRKVQLADEYVYQLAPTVKHFSYNTQYISTPVMGEILPAYYFQTSAPAHKQAYMLVLKAKDKQPYRRYISAQAAGGGPRLLLEVTERQGGVIKLYTLQ